MFGSIEATLFELKVVCSRTLQSKSFKEMYPEEDYNKVVKLYDELDNMECSNNTMLEIVEIPSGLLLRRLKNNELYGEA